MCSDASRSREHLLPVLMDKATEGTAISTVCPAAVSKATERPVRPVESTAGALPEGRREQREDIDTS